MRLGDARARLERDVAETLEIACRPLGCGIGRRDRPQTVLTHSIPPDLRCYAVKHLRNLLIVKETFTA